VRAIDLQNKNPSGACEKNKPPQKNPRKIEKNKNTLAIEAPTRTTTEEASLAKMQPSQKSEPSNSKNGDSKSIANTDVVKKNPKTTIDKYRRSHPHPRQLIDLNPDKTGTVQSQQTLRKME
jgi:hypothetical protein